MTTSCKTIESQSLVSVFFRQLYIIGNIESPMNTEILDKYPKFRNFFNVSMNYRGDADIRINTFGKVFRVRDHPPPGPELDKIIRRFGQENKHMVAKETKVNPKDICTLQLFIGWYL